MSEVQVFNHDTFGAHAVRLDDSGNAVFVLKPLAEALGYREAEKARRILDRDEYWTEVIDLPAPERGTSQVRRRMLVVSESGLYHLIFASTKPEAKTFRRWVTEELLPTVRKAQEVGIDSVKVLKDQIEDLKSEVEMSESEARVMRNTVNKEASTAYRLGYFAGRRASRYDSQAMDPYKGKLFSKPPKNLEYLYALGVARRG